MATVMAVVVAMATDVVMEAVGVISTWALTAAVISTDTAVDMDVMDIMDAPTMAIATVAGDHLPALDMACMSSAQPRIKARPLPVMGTRITRHHKTSMLQLRKIHSQPFKQEI
jgi:hypothetical protein